MPGKRAYFGCLFAPLFSRKTTCLSPPSVAGWPRLVSEELPFGQVKAACARQTGTCLNFSRFCKKLKTPVPGKSRTFGIAFAPLYCSVRTCLSPPSVLAARSGVKSPRVATHFYYTPHNLKIGAPPGENAVPRGRGCPQGRVPHIF